MNRTLAGTLSAVGFWTVACLVGAVQPVPARAAELDLSSADLASLVRRAAVHATGTPANEHAEGSGASATRDPALGARLTELAAALAKADESPESIPRDAIGECLAWLDSEGLAPEISEAVRRRYVRENLYLQIDGSLIFSQYEQDVDEPVTIRQFRDGATISGRGRFTGHVHFDVVPDTERAAVRMLFEGSVQAGLRGSAGPVGFTMQNRTRLTAEKWLWADGDGIATGSIDARADSSLVVNDLWSTLRGPVRRRVASRIGWKRVMASRPGSQRASEIQARRELAARFDAQAQEMANALEETYTEMIRGPLTERGIFPRRLRVSSTDTHLNVAATLAATDQLAGWTPPPTRNGRSAMAITVHESLINNVAETTLAGRTILAEELAATLEPWLGTMPPEFADVGGVSWSLTVADRHPLEVRIADNLVRVVVRCQKITAGAEEFSEPFTVSARYRGAIEGREFVLRRQGGLEIFAPGHLATKLSDGLTDAQDEVRSRFEMILAEELRMSTEGVPFPPPAGTELVPTACVAQNGWLHLTIDPRPLAAVALSESR